jgi:hypothetical protein
MPGRFADAAIDEIHLSDTPGDRRELRVRLQISEAQAAHERSPMRITVADDRDVSVGGWIDVVRAQRQTRMSIAGALDVVIAAERKT